MTIEDFHKKLNKFLNKEINNQEKFSIFSIHCCPEKIEYAYIEKNTGDYRPIKWIALNYEN